MYYFLVCSACGKRNMAHGPKCVRCGNPISKETCELIPVKEEPFSECPFCGKEHDIPVEECSCGFGLSELEYLEKAAKEYEENKARGIDITTQPRCPRCGSTAIATGPRGYSSAFSLVSSLLGGNPVEAGLIGSGRTVNRCAKCGMTWKPKW